MYDDHDKAYGCAFLLLIFACIAGGLFFAYLKTNTYHIGQTFTFAVNRLNEPQWASLAYRGDR